MLILLMAAAACLLPQETSEAEEILKKAERALEGIPSVQIAFDRLSQEYRPSHEHGPYAGGRMDGVFHQGTVQLHPGNRLALKMNIRTGDRKVTWFDVTSTGKSVTLEPAKEARVTVDAPPARLGREYRYMLLRVGAQTAADETVRSLSDFLFEKPKEGESQKPREADPAKRIKMSNLKLLGGEKVNDRETLKLRYTLDEGASYGKPFVMLWIDEKTNLPVRREEEFDSRDWKYKYVETYTINGIRDPAEP